MLVVGCCCCLCFSFRPIEGHRPLARLALRRNVSGRPGLGIPGGRSVHLEVETAMGFQLAGAWAKWIQLPSSF